ncbi:MAG: prepilin peptidase [Candidatus Omnitrophica bacterium]|nr:prepilin peptidase [Candidatus Omnitrophota bacterium]MCM8828274.1 prepilin peptidase [Candidatus Omnitrophota bacterium]
MKEFLVFLVGACFGSFANVCIYRMPRNKSIVFPGSFCPKCRHAIYWYDNIPILSYILLGGRCRYCKKNISSRYPIIEIITGVLTLLLFQKFWAAGYYCEFLFYFVFTLGLIIISGIDFETFLVPDIIVLPLIPLGLLGALLCENFFIPQSGSYIALTRFFYSLSGVLTGAFLVLFLMIIGRIVWKKEAMGGGDLKLLAAIGAFLGWKGVFLSIFFGSILGTVISVALIYSKKKKWDDYVPFGPYLAIGAVLAMLYKGNYFLSLYFIP